MTQDLPSVLQAPKEVEKLEKLRGEINQIASLAMAQKVLDVSTKDAALEIGGHIKRMRKALDDVRKSITAPLQDKVKQVIAFADKLDFPLEEAEDHIRREATRYAQQIAEEQRKEAARIANEKRILEEETNRKLSAAAVFNETFEEQLSDQSDIRKSAAVARSEIVEKEREVKSQAVKGTKEEWNFEITDLKSVPDKYWVIDESLLRYDVRTQKMREIPGVRIYSELKVSLGRY